MRTQYQTKVDIVDKVTVATGLRRDDVNVAASVLFSVMAGEIKRGNNIKIVGFGSFIVKQTPSKPGYNLATRKKVIYPARKRVAFKSYINLEEAE